MPLSDPKIAARYRAAPICKTDPKLCQDAEPDGGLRDRLRQATWDFVQREDGTYTIFGVYVFLIIVMFGGIGIDLMRYERDRANLQYTLDRAVLAAADLDQKQDPKAVVQDYFAKAGLSSYLGSVSVDQGLGYRIVSADASANMRTQFMHMGGVDTLAIPANSTAEERIGGVEISMVLDVSGSMNSNSRLSNLKVAARDFVDQMDTNTQDGKLSISIVPYATQVSATLDLINQFNITKEHEYSNCVNFETADFHSPAISTSAELERTMHFDLWSVTDGRDDTPPDTVKHPVCEDDDAREILPLQKDPNILKSYITNLQAWGNTSIDLGVKWGSALLDPSLRGPIGQLVAAGQVPADFVSRPTNYNDGETLKVIVVMSDGQNTSQYYMRDEFRQGKSGIWWNAADKVYSIHDPYYNDYYWSSDRRWHAKPHGTKTKNGQTTYKSVELENPDLTAFTSLQHLAGKLVGPARGSDWAWNKYYYNAYSAVYSTAKDSRTAAICGAAKDRGVVIFTIGFEAPTRGLNVLKNCASSPAHFFDVKGLEITDAFSSIASSIRKLRLTQ